jgi:hypothetical protein
MRKMMICAAVLALGACQQAEAPATEEAAATEAAPPAASAAQLAPGTYEVTMADGMKITTEVKADGTYEDRDAAGKVTEKGTWAVTDGKSCFDPEGEDAVVCHVDGPVGADGSFTATPDKGDPVTVKKVG